MSNELIACTIFALLAGSQPGAQTIIQRSVAANKLDWQAAPDYSYVERDQEYDGARTYEVSMILGSPYRQLVAIDDKPLSPANQRRQAHRLSEALAQRRAESQSERNTRMLKYQKERRRDRLLMDQLAVAFDFKLLGEEKMAHRDVYVLQATPKANYDPPNIQTEVLTGMEGKLWIDKASFQWVKVEAEVVHPVSIAGFLARVEKGTRFELEKTPVGSGVWLPSHFAMKASAKILGAVTRKEKEDETYSDYHRVGPAIQPAAALPGGS